MDTGKRNRKNGHGKSPAAGRGAPGGKTNPGPYAKYGKRALDILISGAALVVLSPLIGATALLVRTKLGSPVVFKQARPGKDEKIFYLYKFRSMTDERDDKGMLLPDSRRLTPFGKFLRASSIDELLELYNILRGDMSLVGPRPLSIYYLPHYSKEARRRQAVRPGLTGLAQVNGRNSLGWEDRFAYDVEYVDHISFLEDLKIILATAQKVVKAADVSVRGTAKIMDYGPYSTLQEEGRAVEKRDGMTYSEIGSYFWLEKPRDGQAGEPGNPAADTCPAWLPPMGDCAFTFCGRTGMDIVVRDILRQRPVRKVYAPSYSCISMLQAFIDHDVEIVFYQVHFRDGRFVYELDPRHGCDVVLVMSYFGLDASAAHAAIAKLRGTGAVVIEDITHSLLRREGPSPDADYVVASLRKWFAIPTGGWIGKRSGRLLVRPSMAGDQAVEGKILGMEKKYAYLRGHRQEEDSPEARGGQAPAPGPEPGDGEARAGGHGDPERDPEGEAERGPERDLEGNQGRNLEKEEFLSLQAKFDTDLIHVDRLLDMDRTSRMLLDKTDVDAVARRRRDNAKILLEGLQDLDGGILRLPKVDREADTPLFLPIFLKTRDRDALRAFLIGRGIYCPVHWPEVMGAPVGARANELSLICDQRYGEGDMRAILDAIHTWAKGQEKDRENGEWTR